jgi:hypothetical protein
MIEAKRQEALKRRASKREEREREAKRAKLEHSNNIAPAQRTLEAYFPTQASQTVKNTPHIWYLPLLLLTPSSQALEKGSKITFKFHEKDKNLAEGLCLFTAIFSEEEIEDLERKVMGLLAQGRSGTLEGEVMCKQVVPYR